MKPDGFVYLKVPDLQLVAELIAVRGLEDMAYESPAGPITPLDMIYGHSASLAAGNSFMAHRTGFDPLLLKRLLQSNGFGYGAMKRKEAFELSAVAFKGNGAGNPVRNRILAELEF